MSCKRCGMHGSIAVAAALRRRVSRMNCVRSGSSRGPSETYWSQAPADSKALMAGCGKGQVKLWPLDGQGGAATFHGHSVVQGLALLPDGQTFISVAGSLRFWDVGTRRENAPNVSPRAGGFSCLALSPDGRRFATGASDGRITIWDVASHHELATPDGDHLVSASKDQLRVWRAASWAEADAVEKEAGK